MPRSMMIARPDVEPFIAFHPRDRVGGIPQSSGNCSRSTAFSTSGVGYEEIRFDEVNWRMRSISGTMR